MPPITKGVKFILFANILVFALGFLLKNTIDLDKYLALYYIKSSYFKPMQFITYMFVHGSLMHLFFNMFALIQFGSVIEGIWGTKRFAFYYLITGIGAAVVHMIVTHYQMHPLTDAINTYLNNPTPDTLVALSHASNIFNEAVISEIAEAWSQGLANEQEIIDATISQIQEIMNYPVMAHPMVGASGAVFGLLLAFGVMFPDLKLQIIFIPIGIPARYFVLIYGIIELFCGIQSFEGDNIAHFAHLGGMLFGIILLLWWKRNPHNEMFN